MRTMLLFEFWNIQIYSAVYSIGKNCYSSFDSFRAVPDYLLTVVCNVLSRSPLETMKRRLEKLKSWRGLADELAGKNQEIFDSMNPGLKGKHWALLGRLAVQVDWPDKHIHQDVRDGFKLTGLQNPSGIFAADIKPRSLTEEDLVKQIKFLQPALWGKVQSSPSAEYDQDLWDMTMQELTDKGGS